MELLNYNNKATTSLLSSQEKMEFLFPFQKGKSIFGTALHEANSTEKQLMAQVKGGLSQTKCTSWSGCPIFILLKIQLHSNSFFGFSQNNNKTKRQHVHNMFY